MHDLFRVLPGDRYKQVHTLHGIASLLCLTLSAICCLDHFHCRVHVPEVYPDLTSHRVLAMEFIDGVQVTDKQGLQRLGISPSSLAQLVSETFNEMIFIHGDVHCDPHAANLVGVWATQLMLCCVGVCVACPQHGNRAWRNMRARLADKLEDAAAAQHELHTVYPTPLALHRLLSQLCLHSPASQVPCALSVHCCCAFASVVLSAAGAQGAC